jgi:hypothetical protein
MGFICSKCGVVLSFMLELCFVIKSFYFVLQLVGLQLRGQTEGNFENFGLGFHF